MTKDPPVEKPKPSSRVTRAAEALRANLARRKAQARLRRLEPAKGVATDASPARDRDK